MPESQLAATEPSEEQEPPEQIARPRRLETDGREAERNPPPWPGIGATGCICRGIYKMRCPVHGIRSTFSAEIVKAGVSAFPSRIPHNTAK